MVDGLTTDPTAARASAEQQSIALVLAVLGSATTNIGKVLQKQATTDLPQLAVERKVLLSYATNSLWRVGLVADVGGALGTLAALSMAPLSLIQPVSGCGIAFLAVFSHFYLKEELQATERVGVFMAVLGTAGIGMTATPGPDATPQAGSGAALLLLCCSAFAGLEALLRRIPQLGSGGTRRGALSSGMPQAPRLQEMADAQGLGEVMADLAVSCTELDQQTALSRIELIAGPARE